MNESFVADQTVIEPIRRGNSAKRRMYLQCTETTFEYKEVIRAAHTGSQLITDKEPHINLLVYAVVYCSDYGL